MFYKFECKALFDLDIVGFCLLSGLWPEEYYTDDVAIQSVLLYHGMFNETKDPWKVNLCMFCEDIVKNDFEMCLQEVVGLVPHRRVFFCVSA